MSETSFGGEFTTSDTAWRTVEDLTIGDNKTTTIRCPFLARKTNGTTARWERMIVVERTSGADVRVIASGLVDLVSPIKDLGAALWDVDVQTIATDQVRVRVKGAADVFWTAVGFKEEFAP